MRRPSLLFLVLVLALGCGKKAPPPPPPDAGGGEEAEGEGTTDPSERDKLLAALKGRKSEAQRDAAEAIATLAEADPSVIDALIDMLKDKSNVGLGKINSGQINSTREAAAVALLRCGAKGETALKDRGIAILREGLNDKDAAVREHTAYTLGVFGPKVKVLSLSLQRLCTDPDPNVRIAAFDALRTVGVADVSQIAALLTDKDATVRRPAAELILGLTEIPGDAVPALTRALDDDDDMIRVAGAEGIAAAAPKGTGALTAEKLAAVIARSYPPKYDAKTDRLDGPEASYWKALLRIGKPAVPAITTLLTHTNPRVRVLAARSLGDIGEAAKPAADALRKLLADEFADVVIEAVCTLYRLGEGDANTERLIALGLQSTERGVAAAAVSAIARMGPAGKPLIPRALEQLESPRPEARYAAVMFVGLLPPDEAAKAVPALAKRVTDETVEIRRAVGIVLERLGPVGSPAADAVGKAMLAEPDDIAKEQFVNALVAMGPGAKPAIAGLVPLVNTPAVGVVMRVKVIGAVAVADPGSGDVAAALVKAATDKDPTVRSAVAGAMGKLTPLPPDARAALVKFARDDSRLPVRSAAVRALAEAGAKAKGAKGELEAIADGKMLGLALWAKVALAAVDGDVTKAAGTIRAGLGDRRGEVRTAAAQALPLVGPTTADVPALVKILKEPGAEAKEAAAVALGKIGPPAKEAVTRLTELLTDKESEVRIAAAEALGRIGPGALPAAAKLRELLRDPLVAATARRAMDRIGIPDDGGKK